MFSNATRTAPKSYAILPVLATLLLCFTIQAQSTQSRLDGYTPTELQQGTPAGSYLLSGFESISNYNGNLNVALPLLHIGGRGAAGHTITLPINFKWEVIRGSETQGISDDVTFKAGDVYQVGYSPGVLIGTSVMNIPAPGTACPPSTFRTFLTRLRFIMPDGTEVQLHDKKYQGAGQYVDVSCNPIFPNRGKVFVTDDGESMTFISNTDILDQPAYVGGPNDFRPSGILLMKDGTRYWIDTGRVRRIRDRNGNTVTYTYEPGSPYGRLLTATDSLNRQVSITYATVIPGYDEITYKGFGGATRSIKVYFNSLSNILRPGSTVQLLNQLFPEIYSYSLYNGNSNFSPGLISKVELPDQRTYQFYYNSYGEVARILLPTGGGFDYEYAGGAFGVNDVSHLPTISRRCIARKVFNTLTATTPPASPPAGTLEKIENYVIETGQYSVSGNTIVRVEHRDGANVLLAQEKHYYYGAPFEYLNNSGEPVLYSIWSSGKEFKTESFDVAGGVAGSVLRRSETTWSPSVPNPYPILNTLPAPNPKIAETITSLVETNQVAKQTFSYDQYNNPTDVWEYDYGPGAPSSTPIRQTHTDYLTSGYDTIVGGITAPDAAATIHIRSLPTQQIVYDGATAKARTVYEYDNYTNTAPRAALLNRTNITGLVSRNETTQALGYNATVDTMRGNATAVTRYANAAASTGPVTVYAQFDIAGNVVKAIDAITPNGNATNFDFTDCFGAPNGDARLPTNPTELSAAGQSTYAFPTIVTNALGHIAYTQLDYYIGKPVDTEDPNNVKSSLYYEDTLDRPTKSIAAVGTSVQRQTLIRYNDTGNTNGAGDPPYSATTLSDKDTYQESNSGNGLKATARYDGLGRTWRKAAFEGSGNWALTDTEFDALGRVKRVSNPYRSTSLTGAVNPSGEWTTSTYDALSRVTQVTTPDNAQVNTAYNGNQVLVTDQASKKRMSETDALGRLKKVWEITAADSATVSVGFPSQSFTAGYLTNYSYDTLDNLTTVTQQIGTSGTTQTRTFVYDSLKRLTQATNPESGTTNYTYDNNGNLTFKEQIMTPQPNRFTWYGYDALNRSTGYYTNNADTPQVVHIYDTLANGKGRLGYSYTASYWVGCTSWKYLTFNPITSYDALGRPAGQEQYYRDAADTTWGTAYTTSRTYDLAGNVKSQTYPSGRVVNYSYNNAGQMSEFKGNLGDGTNRNYATEMAYNAAGQMSKEAWGKAGGSYGGMTTPLYQNKHYNNRLQLYDIRLGTSSTDEWTWNRGALRMFYDSNFAYGNGGTNNNGNVYRMDHFVPGDDGVSTWTMSLDYYGYDDLNRITGIWENKAAHNLGETSTGLTQQYLYDRFGNRTVNNAVSNFGAFNLPFTVDQTTNRLLAPNGAISYNAVGNQTNDSYTGAGSRTYDANNKLVSAQTTGGGTVSYTYNANGSRVSKTVNGTTTTWYIYGVGGELVAEYPAQGATNMPQIEYGYRNGELLVEGGCDAVRWRVTDHLGSTRMTVGTAGTLASVKRTDYLPFGEELGAGHGPRTTTQGYSQTDCWRQKFTGYERDVETGLDYAQARMFSGAQGRFTSVDPSLASGRIWNPQSWNRYTYALNRTLSLIDPTGLEDEDVDPQSGRKNQEEKPLEKVKVNDVPNIKKNPKTTLINPVRGELPVGGEFKVEYEFTIYFNDDLQAKGVNPADAGKVQPIESLTGSLTGTLQEGATAIIERTDVKTQVSIEGEFARVQKVETFKVKEKAPSGINYEIVVKDPVTGDVDRVRSKSSASTPKDNRGRTRPEYIAVNHKLEPRK